jgi:hypothetical protein
LRLRAPSAGLPFLRIPLHPPRHESVSLHSPSLLPLDGQRFGDVSSWLNYYLNDRTQIVGGGGSDLLDGSDIDAQLVGGDGNDHLEASGGNDLRDGSWGDATLLGGNGHDPLDDHYGSDALNGGEGSDTSCVTGDVDIRLTSFKATNGIERIEAGAGTGQVRCPGGSGTDIFDFTCTTIATPNERIETGSGNDLVASSSGNDQLDTGSDQVRLTGGSGDPLSPDAMRWTPATLTRRFYPIESTAFQSVGT